MKLIEGDNVSAMETGHALNTFIETLEQRKKNKFLSSAVQTEVEKVGATCRTVSKNRVLATAETFYGS